MKSRSISKLIITALVVCAAGGATAGCRQGRMEKRLLSDDPGVRVKALIQARRMDYKRKEPLVAALAGWLGVDGVKSERAAEALGMLGNAAIPPVKTALASEDVVTRLNALGAARRMHGQSVFLVSEVTARLSDPHPLVREEAAVVLGSFGAAAAAAADALAHALAEDPSAFVREAAEDALSAVQPAPSLATHPS